MKTLSDLEKAHDIFLEIKALDQQIIDNEKMAQRLVNLDELVPVNIGLPEENPEKITGEYESYFQTMESMITHTVFGRHPYTRQPTMSGNSTISKEYTKMVTPPAAIRICQFIHDDLVCRREKYIAQLRKLGLNF